MNAKDKKEIEEILEKLRAVTGPLDELKGKIEDLASGEREKFDNMNEGLQQSERGQAIDAAANDLESAQSEAESAYSSIETAIENLEQSTQY